MRARKNPARTGNEQLNLPFTSEPKVNRSNGAEPLTVRISDAVRMTGIGRSKLYELIAAGEIETVKVGRCTLVPMESLRDFISRAYSASGLSNGGQRCREAIGG